MSAPLHVFDEAIRLGGPAAGGSCVGHAPDTTLFVRGGLPGELVTVRATGSTRGGRITFADVVEVIEASQHRVTPPCPLTGVCGGCDLQHVAPSFQLEWKAQVLRDQLQRIGGIEAIVGVPLYQAVTVTRPTSAEGSNDAATADDGALGWRTRVAVDADAAGRACFHAHRSDHLVPVAHCPVVVAELQAGFGHRWPSGQRVHLALGQGQPTASAAGDDGRAPNGWRVAGTVTREAAGRRWRVAVDGFWQAHREAPDLLVAAVRRVLAPQPGESVLDLYSGVGLFAGSLAGDVGASARVAAVEGDERAARLARRNLHDLPGVRLHHGGVRRWLGSPVGREVLAGVDLVVLDPPRASAGREVVAALAASSARAVAYVACDGASLARDARLFHQQGWSLASLAAFDLFGMSHHLEAVALFLPPDSELLPPTL